jgi:hypothetical protein
MLPMFTGQWTTRSGFTGGECRSRAGGGRSLPPYNPAVTAIRLAIATLAVLSPGIVLARLLGRPSASASLVCALAALFVALAVVFATGSSFVLALWLLLAITAAALLVAVREGLWLRATKSPRGPSARSPSPRSARRDRLWLRATKFDLPWLGVLAAGMVFAALLWFVLPVPTGDALFHLARIRKLVELDELSLAGVGEFVDGGLHPGYAFPLWHGFVAAVAQIAGVDPATAIEHESAVLAPVAFVVVYEAGREAFRSAWLGAAALVATVALTALSVGSGGAFRSLVLPATAGGRLLLVPATLALLFAYLNEPTRRGLVLVALAAFVLAVVHPSYALFAVLLVAGFLFAQALLDWTELRRLALAFAALTAGAAVFLAWLFPVVQTATSYTPTNEQLTSRAHGIERYPGQIDFSSPNRYRLAPEVVSRSGPVPIAALAVLPLALLAARRRWAPFVLGTTLAALTVLLVPFVFPRFVDAVSLSQARRLAGFIPFAFALAGGAAVVARLGSYAILPFALVAGFVVQRAYPGDFGYLLDEGGPAEIVWLAFVLGALALGIGALLRPPLPALERSDWLAFAAVVLFVLPIAIAANWQRAQPGTELTPGLVEAVQRQVAAGDVVLADPETSYWLAAYAPVYVVAAPPAHVGDTEDNRPHERVEQWRRFDRSGELPPSADWLVLDNLRTRRECSPTRYADRRYALCAVSELRR